jgi:hypothetical protein
MSVSDAKKPAPTSDVDLCEPGTHKWTLGSRVGEYCARCGWSRAAYELKTRDLSRDSLRRYSVSEQAAAPVADDDDAETDPDLKLGDRGQ